MIPTWISTQRAPAPPTTLYIDAAVLLSEGVETPNTGFANNPPELVGGFLSMQPFPGYTVIGIFSSLIGFQVNVVGDAVSLLTGSTITINGETLVLADTVNYDPLNGNTVALYEPLTLPLNAGERYPLSFTLIPVAPFFIDAGELYEAGVPMGVYGYASLSEITGGSLSAQPLEGRTLRVLSGSSESVLVTVEGDAVNLLIGSTLTIDGTPLSVIDGPNYLSDQDITEVRYTSYVFTQRRYYFEFTIVQPDPSNIFIDDFNRADGPLGANWTKVGTGTATANIFENTVGWVTGSASPYLAPDTGSVYHFAESEVINLDSQNSFSTGICIVNNRSYIGCRVRGAQSQLYYGTDTLELTLITWITTPPVGHKIRLWRTLEGTVSAGTVAPDGTLTTVYSGFVVPAELASSTRAGFIVRNNTVPKALDNWRSGPTAEL